MKKNDAIIKMCEILIDTANTIKDRLNKNLYIDFNYHAQELNFIMQSFKGLNNNHIIFEDINKFKKGAKNDEN